MDLYSEVVLDYYRNPRNKGPLVGAQASARDFSPLCGDDVAVHLRFSGGGRVEKAFFEGAGCAISQASASMLCEAVEGKSVEEVRALGGEFVFSLLGARVSPARVGCALLPLKVLKLALYSFLSRGAVGGLGWV